ncbi:MAG: DNA-processing protein DprA, partial [Candidatus Komeilibacteria bacterium]|nr:DNA-processing protein DprA [Candidatus Komeilibacteria bacterium]
MANTPDPWLGFALIPGFGPAKFKKVCQYFGDPATALAGSFDNFIKAGLPENLATAITQAQKKSDLTDAQNKLTTQNIKTVRLIDPDYPKLLKQIADPPFMIFYRGSLASLAMPCLAIVGSRKFTAYGQRVTQELAESLSARGVTIVSGLAMGIDTFAHKSCLETGGATVAVLPGGVAPSDIAPQTNYWLAEKIAGAKNNDSNRKNSGGQNPAADPNLSASNIGALIAEDAGAAITGRNLTQKFSFPRRNRLISGLCLGTIIIEAPIKSGALITAYHALN